MPILKRYFFNISHIDKIAIFSIFNSAILIDLLFPKGVVEGKDLRNATAVVAY
jgi:hypothetical protein